mgnify:CR=1 FL=1
MTSNQNQNTVEFNNSEDKKTLGLIWNSKEDKLKYNIKIESSTSNLIKRSILSVIVQIFDPLGLISPLVVKTKIIMQHWDEKIPKNFKKGGSNIWKS